MEPSPRSGRLQEGLYALWFSAVREADCEFTCPCPSAKALGYWHSVRFADVANRLSQQSHYHQRIIFMIGRSTTPWRG